MLSLLLGTTVKLCVLPSALILYSELKCIILTMPAKPCIFIVIFVKSSWFLMRLTTCCFLGFYFVFYKIKLISPLWLPEQPKEGKGFRYESICLRRCCVCMFSNCWRGVGGAWLVFWWPFDFGVSSFNYSYELIIFSSSPLI